MLFRFSPFWIKSGPPLNRPFQPYTFEHPNTFRFPPPLPSSYPLSLAAPATALRPARLIPQTPPPTNPLTPVTTNTTNAGFFRRIHTHIYPLTFSLSNPPHNRVALLFYAFCPFFCLLGINGELNRLEVGKTLEITIFWIGGVCGLRLPQAHWRLACRNPARGS